MRFFIRSVGTVYIFILKDFFFFFQVWKAEADDLNGHDGLTRLVAVKSIKETASQKEKQELLHEIYIMQKIGTHPNVVTLLACCTEQGEFEYYIIIL